VHRDIDQLTASTFDLLVVGGGICGLTIACDAAARGLTVALIDRDDFGCGSSFNHLRTIHGGLRYLQTLDLARARESIRERRTLARIAPHTLRPLSFAVPLHRSMTKGKLAVRVGFLLDRVLARGRNDGVVPSLHLPGGRVVSRSEAVERFPGMRRQGLTGAAVWADYVTTETDRLTFSWALAAAEHGAVLANHVEATEPTVEGRRVTGVRAVDRASARDVAISARLTVNASGAGVERLLAPLGTSARVPLLKAMNLVTRREAGGEAIGGRSSSGRHLFLVPWRGRALFGTWESARLCPAGDDAISEAEITAFIDEINQAFPSLDLNLDEVTLVHRGLVPAVVLASGAVALEGRDQIRDHADEGIDGLISVAGAKYTTARAVAERVTDRVLTKLQRPAVSCRTTDPLPGGERGALGDPLTAVEEARHDYDALFPSDTLPHLVAAYGSRYERIAALAAERPELRARVGDQSPVIAAQLVWAVRREMAITLCDAVIRRTPLGALGYPGEETAERAADIVGAELEWSADRRRMELVALRRFYQR
jgi:glycerol-3-phosphate dehydrogenase